MTENERIIEEFIYDYPICEFYHITKNDLVFSDKVRYICEHECQRYNKSWACPPVIGSIEECMKECDEYDIIGDIISCTQKVNVWTDEVIWDLKIKALDIIINVFINAEDLVGEPKVGRRFKGQIWLQGEIEFLEKTKTVE